MFDKNINAFIGKIHSIQVIQFIFMFLVFKIKTHQAPSAMERK